VVDGCCSVDILGEDRLELTPVEDQYPVEALAADCADEMLGEGVGRGARIGVRMIRILRIGKTPCAGGSVVWPPRASWWPSCSVRPTSRKIEPLPRPGCRGGSGDHPPTAAPAPDSGPGRVAPGGAALASPAIGSSDLDPPTAACREAIATPPAVPSPSSGGRLTPERRAGLGSRPSPDHLTGSPLSQNQLVMAVAPAAPRFWRSGIHGLHYRSESISGGPDGPDLRAPAARPAKVPCAHWECLSAKWGEFCRDLLRYVRGLPT